MPPGRPLGAKRTAWRTVSSCVGDCGAPCAFAGGAGNYPCPSVALARRRGATRELRGFCTAGARAATNDRPARMRVFSAVNLGNSSEASHEAGFRDLESGYALCASPSHSVEIPAEGGFAGAALVTTPGSRRSASLGLCQWRRAVSLEERVPYFPASHASTLASLDIPAMVVTHAIDRGAEGLRWRFNLAALPDGNDSKQQLLGEGTTHRPHPSTQVRLSTKRSLRKFCPTRDFRGADRASGSRPVPTITTIAVLCRTKGLFHPPV